MPPPSDGFKTPDPFEFLKSLWSPMGVPVPGMVTPTMDVAEIDKRISDLKSVENWLSLNLNVLRMTIQGLEMQRATISAVQGGMAAAARAMQPSLQSSDAAPDSKTAGAGAHDAWWSVLQQAQKAAEQAAAQVADQARARNDSGSTDKK
jgi:hypothetical protein